MINQQDLSEQTVFSVKEIEMAERYLTRWYQNNKKEEFTDKKLIEIINKCSSACKFQKISIMTALEHFYPNPSIFENTPPAKKTGPGFYLTQKMYNG